jgi:hypothetical protein
VAWNADGITVVSQSRTDDDPHTDIYIHDNTIAMAPRSGDTMAVANGWVMDWSGILFDTSSNNRGANNRYWFPSVENGTTRYAWNGTKSTLSALESTPAEAGGAYLSATGKNDALGAVSVPTSPVSR